MKPLTEDKRLQYLMDARQYAIEMREEIYARQDPDDGKIDYVEFIVALICDQAVDNIDRKIKS